MVNVRNYNPIWPEVIVWWGAGASKSLNLLTTDDIAKQITILAKEDSLKAENRWYLFKWIRWNKRSFKKIIKLFWKPKWFGRRYKN